MAGIVLWIGKMTSDEFKALVETFMAQTGTSATAFGKRYAADPLFVFQLREGREPREATRERVLSAMSAKATTS